MGEKKLVLVGAILSIVLLAFCSANATTQAIITVDPSVRYQRISGWQAVAEIGQIDFPDGYGLWRDEVADQAANDLGINRVMIRIRQREEDPNDNSDPFVINWSGIDFSRIDSEVDAVVEPLKQRLEARGEQLHVNLKFNNGSAPTIHSNDPEEYAELIEATFLHLDSKYGWVPDSVDVVNEPKTSKGWTATKIGEAIVATATRLQSHGYSPFFVAPSTIQVNIAVSWFDQMVANVPGALPYVGEIAYHCYSGCGDDANLLAVGDRTVQYGISSAETEKMGHNYENLHRDLKLARVSAWEQFALAYPGTSDDGGSYYMIDNSDPANPVVNIGSRTKFLRQYFKYIRAGAERIEATSSDGTFDPLAFINNDGGYVVVVKAAGGGGFAIDGLPAGTYGIKYTTNSEYDVDLPEVTIGSGQSLNASIPDKGVVTVYQATTSPTVTPTDTPTATPTDTPTPTPVATPKGGSDHSCYLSFVMN